MKNKKDQEEQDNRNPEIVQTQNYLMLLGLKHHQLLLGRVTSKVSLFFMKQNSIMLYNIYFGIVSDFMLKYICNIVIFSQWWMGHYYSTAAAVEDF